MLLSSVSGTDAQQSTVLQQQRKRMNFRKPPDAIGKGRGTSRSIGSGRESHHGRRWTGSSRGNGHAGAGSIALHRQRKNKYENRLTSGYPFEYKSASGVVFNHMGSPLSLFYQGFARVLRWSGAAHMSQRLVYSKRLQRQPKQ